MNIDLDPELFGRTMGQIVREALHPIRQRIEALEDVKVVKSLDAELTDVLADLIDRVDHIQREVLERGFTYRGYWRQGSQATRNQAFTHDGSLWLALRDTSDMPSNESVDWSIIARKGRDAK